MLVGLGSLEDVYKEFVAALLDALNLRFIICKNSCKNAVCIADHASFHVKTTGNRVSWIAKYAILSTCSMIFYKLFMQKVLIN
jgi:hypothetical protein